MKQGEIWYANLNPVEGSEQAGNRPVVIVSGNLLNEHAPVIWICPLTTKIKNYHGDVILAPNTKNGLRESSEILTMHIRSIAKIRLSKKIGNVTKIELETIHKTIGELLNF